MSIEFVVGVGTVNIYSAYQSEMAATAWGRTGERRLSIRISDSVFVGCYRGLIYIVIMILCGRKRIFIISAVCAATVQRKYKP